MQFEEEYRSAYEELFAGDVVSGLARLRKLADCQYSSAIVLLGWAYATGHFVPQNLELAEKLFGAAASAGSLRASYYLGKLLLRQKKYELSLEEFFRSGEKGFAPSCYRIGLAFENGSGISRNLTKASFWYGRASTLFHRQALLHLGMLETSGKLGWKQIPIGFVRLSIARVLKFFDMLGASHKDVNLN